MSHTNNKEVEELFKYDLIPVQVKEESPHYWEGYKKTCEILKPKIEELLHQELQKAREQTIHRILAIVSSKQNQYTSTYERGYQDCVKNILESIHHYQSVKDQSELDQPNNK